MNLEHQLPPLLDPAVVLDDLLDLPPEEPPTKSTDLPLPGFDMAHHHPVDPPRPDAFDRKQDGRYDITTGEIKLQIPEADKAQIDQPRFNVVSPRLESAADGVETRVTLPVDKPKKLMGGIPRNGRIGALAEKLNFGGHGIPLTIHGQKNGTVSRNQEESERTIKEFEHIVALRPVPKGRRKPRAYLAFSVHTASDKQDLPASTAMQLFPHVKAAEEPETTHLADAMPVEPIESKLVANAEALAVALAALVAEAKSSEEVVEEQDQVISEEPFELDFETVETIEAIDTVDMVTVKSINDDSSVI